LNVVNVLINIVFILNVVNVLICNCIYIECGKCFDLKLYLY